MREAVDLARSYGDELYENDGCLQVIVDALYPIIDNIISIEFTNYSDFAGEPSEDVRHNVWCYMLERPLRNITWSRGYEEIASYLITCVRMLIKNEFRSAIKRKYAQNELRTNLFRYRHAHDPVDSNPVLATLITTETVQEARQFARRVNLSGDDVIAFRVALYLVRNEVA